MAKNKGKQFEQQVFEAFSKVDGVSIDRIPDQVTRYKGSSSNICDYVVYKQPTLLYLECKSVHGNTLSIHSEPKMGKDGKLHGFHGNIRDNQWDGLMDKSKIKGVKAGVICWWVDKDMTLYIPIQELDRLYKEGNKSVRFDFESSSIVEVVGTKKRVYYDYDVADFFNKIF